MLVAGEKTLRLLWHPLRGVLREHKGSMEAELLLGFSGPHHGFWKLH